jgi:hypothetical protein
MMSSNHGLPHIPLQLKMFELVRPGVSLSKSIQEPVRKGLNVTMKGTEVVVRTGMSGIGAVNYLCLWVHEHFPNITQVYVHVDAHYLSLMQ